MPWHPWRCPAQKGKTDESRQPKPPAIVRADAFLAVHCKPHWQRADGTSCAGACRVGRRAATCVRGRRVDVLAAALAGVAPLAGACSDAQINS